MESSDSGMRFMAGCMWEKRRKNGMEVEVRTWKISSRPKLSGAKGQDREQPSEKLKKCGFLLVGGEPGLRYRKKVKGLISDEPE